MQFKYADDSTIIAPIWKEVDYSDQLVSQFLDWTNTNGMSCSPRKCKELMIKKRGNRDLYSPIGMIPSCKELRLSIYTASESDLTPVKCFLDLCFKRKYTYKPVSVYDFLERQDGKIFRKVSNAK